MNKIYLSFLLAALAPSPALAAYPAAAPVAGPQSFDTVWDFDQPLESERRLRAQTLSAQSQGRFWKLQLQTQIARALGLQGKYAKAQKVLDAVEKPAAGDAATTVRYLLERGRVLWGAGKPEQAKPFFQTAGRMAADHQLDFFTVDADRMLALYEKNDQGKALWMNKAVDSAKASADPATKRWMGYLADRLAWMEADQLKFSDALKLFRTARQAQETAGDMDSERKERWAAAKMLRLLARPNEALREQQKLESEYDREGKTNGFVAEELGELFLALGFEDRAREYSRTALKVLTNQGFLEKDPSQVARLIEMVADPIPGPLKSKK